MNHPVAVDHRIPTTAGCGAHAARPDHEAAARSLEATGEYRILRRVPAGAIVAATVPRPIGIGVAVALDTETTGVDTEFCEVIELAMVRLEFDRADGRILAVTGRYQAFQQPSVPIPQAVTRLTGISDADAAGCSIDPAAVSRLLAGADLVLAHNAAFDRPVVERYWPGFAAKAWACSLKDVNWQAAGYEGGKLGHLILQAGGFHRGHRAMDDVDALLHLLGQPLPSSGRIGMAALVEQAGRDTVRIWADGAPYRFKDDLRARGYRWSDGKRGTPRAWYRDLNEREADEEALFLRDQMFGRDQHVFLPMRRISAVDRYSRRAERP